MYRRKHNSLRFRKKIFKKTNKPVEYIHVDNPVTNQDYRQIHFNNWCKAKKVYCGSYLPINPELLIRKGWDRKSYNDGKQQDYVRKSTKQEVRYDAESEKNDIGHYHWFIGRNHKGRKIKGYYFDRSKRIVRKGEDASHILPLDEEFNRKNLEFLKSKYKKHRD